MTTSGLREAEVAAFVGQHLAGDATAVRGLRHGQWSRAFSFESDGREYVIRFSATDEDFRKDQRAMRYGSAALPVPKIVEVGVAFGGFFAISEHLEGAFLDDLDDVSLRRALPALLSVLDAVRQADIRDTSGFGLWDAAGHGPHASWRDALLACGIDAPGGRTFGWSAGLAERPAARRVFERAYSRLASLVEGCLDERYLVHSDLLAYNVLVDLDADGIAAVLDWGSSLYGDFLWDVAWLTFWQPWYTAWRGIDFRAETLGHYARIGLRVPDFEPRMRSCELAIGLDGMAYQAFRRRWDDLDWTTKRVEGLI